MGSDEKLLAERSPISHVEQITTPCLIQHILNDPVVSLNQAERMYEAMQKSGKQVALSLFSIEAHGIHNAKLMKRAMEENLKLFAEL